MKQDQLKQRLLLLDKEELICMITKIHADLGVVKPYLSGTDYYPRISPFSHEQFNHGIAQANTFETKKECKEFCSEIASYLQMIVEYHFDK